MPEILKVLREIIKISAWGMSAVFVCSALLSLIGCAKKVYIFEKTC